MNGQESSVVGGSEAFLGRGPMRRQQNTGGAVGSVSDEARTTLSWLTPDLKTTLASLDGAPAALATAAVQLLPFGSRAALIELQLAKAPIAGDSCAVIELTPFAYEVMQAAALEASADPGAVSDWLQRARVAADFDAAS